MSAVFPAWSTAFEELRVIVSPPVKLTSEPNVTVNALSKDPEFT